MTAQAVIYGCEGPALTDWERGFFAAADPLGFVLFARNCVDPEQLRALVAALRATVGREDAPVLIDQEGGRVTRLKPPAWRAAPAAGVFDDLARRDLASACEAAEVNARLLALELRALGIDVDCLPLLDLRLPEGHGIIGDRALGSDPEQVIALGRAVCRGLSAAGVTPVIKHIPGHGRARVDSHEALPQVDAPLAVLRDSDFLPFKALAEAPWGMTAHIVYGAIDPERPATTSPKVIAEIIRGEIGFDGLLLSDDLSMKALSGGLGERARAALAAGCDVALHCNGERAEMEAVAAAVSPLSPAAEARLARGRAGLGTAPPIAEFAALSQRLERLLAG
ncbi:MAG: beta-N-acetylhexosaminidase [Kiloniellales bacterium]|nr:beta-N-acetylhexosaminidase [Kiloniellales bacterium]